MLAKWPCEEVHGCGRTQSELQCYEMPYTRGPSSRCDGALDGTPAAHVPPDCTQDKLERVGRLVNPSASAEIGITQVSKHSFQGMVAGECWHPYTGEAIR